MMINFLENYYYLIIVLIVLIQNVLIETLTINDFYRPNENDKSAELPIGDENYLFVKLGTPIHFYGDIYDHIYINTNGILTFGVEFPQFSNVPFPLEYPAIAPFYTNVDTTGSNYTSSISYFITTEVGALERAKELIKLGFSDSYDFEPIELFVATWENVGYFNGNNGKQNTFQAVIICGEEETYTLYLYPMNGLNWIQSDIGESGLPDVRAQAGFVSEDGRYYALKGSGSDNVKYLNELTNRGISGVWIYRIGPLGFKDNIEEPDQISTSSGSTDDIINNNEQTCAVHGRRKCHSSADCINTPSGFYCKCKNGYYGNGCNCLKDDQPIRVSGKINGQLGDLNISTQLQSYVVMNNGRSYTAISTLNSDSGFSLQLLHIFGGGIGWLFGKPIGTSKNGYQITGGIFNITSRIQFDDSDKNIYVVQRFQGLNVWDQLSVNIELSGNLPNVYEGDIITIPDFMEEYYFDGYETIRCNERQHIILGDQNIYYNVSHEITFNNCNVNYDNDIADLIIPVIQYNHVSKVKSVYQNRENALRIAMVNKLILNRQSNPCVDGSAICGENTICMANDDIEGYSCECKNGFAPSAPINGIDNCVDINECNSENICDKNADCFNELGGYSCRCHTGFVGNGGQCLSIYDVSTTPIPPIYSLPTIPPIILSDNNWNCGGQCSANAQCIQGVCVCNNGWNGDGIECIYNCPTDYVWSIDKCSPISNVDEEDTEIQPFCHQQGCSCPTGYELIEYVIGSVCRLYEQTNSSVNIYNDNNNYGTADDDNNNNNYKPYSNEERQQIPCDVENNCDPNANCEWIEIELTNKCVCNPRYEGDGYSCTEIELSCIYENICDIHASCAYDENVGKSICKCDTGYMGDGKYCHVAPDCHLHEDCGANSICDGGTCICDKDFERDMSDFCVPNHSCGGAYCAENAICQWDHIERVSYCHCPEDFIGDGLKSCKSKPPPCNIRNNCGLNAICMPNYRDSAIYECVCNTGYYGDGFVCLPEINCLNVPNMCDVNARCISTTSGLQCICNTGYSGNGTYCTEPPRFESGFLLISQGVATVRVPFDGKRGKPVSMSSMAIGVDKDCSEGRVYWSDISAKNIVSSKYDGTDRKIFISEDVLSPEGVAVDWISRKVYWTDSTKDTIEVANIDNSTLRSVIIRKYLVNPRGIAVDPHQNKLFWSDWNRDAPKIEWSNLDGSEREILLSDPRVKLPNSLSISPNTGELCFADAGTNKIECIDTYSKIVRVIATNLSYPFGLTVTSDHYYWTDWTTKKIESIDYYGNRQIGISSPLFGNHKMYGLTAITDKCPMFFSPCVINNGDCPTDRLCLINLKSTTGRTCKCINSLTCNDIFLD